MLLLRDFFGLDFGNDPDELWSVLFELAYKSGGSGLGLTMGDAMDLPLFRLIWFYEKLVEKRRAEASAIRAAQKKKK